MEVRPRQVRPAEVPLDVAVFLPPLVPPLNPLLEDLEMFRVRHCRVTSLASGMLRMIFEGHTVCDSSWPVNASTVCVAAAMPERQTRFLEVEWDELPESSARVRCFILHRSEF